MKKLFGHRSGKSGSRKYRDAWDDMEDLDYAEDFDEGYDAGEYYTDEDGEEYVNNEFGMEDGEEYYFADNGAQVYDAGSEEAGYAAEADEFGMEYTEEYYAQEACAGYYGEDSEEYYAGSEETGYVMESDECGAGYTEGYDADDDRAEYTEEYDADDGNAEYAEEYDAGDDNAEYAEEYYEEDDLEYLQEQIKGRGRQRADSGNFFQKIVNAFSRMDSVDRIVACTGVAVLILALVTGTVFAGTRIAGRQMDSFATVGEQLDGIDVIGGDGLLAVADAKIARQEVVDLLQEEENQEKENEGYEEEEYSNEVTVALNMTSIKKDLKIKFVNKKTGKLISNVPFEVTVTDPKGKTLTWKDEDKDGIIYKTEIASGNYSVALNELAGFEQYKISTAAQSVKVKENLDYEKVDVEDEIKTEAEIDAAKEDTAKNDVVEESKLQDTVAWVESTRTPVEESYVEVAKSTIEDPAKLVASFGGFVKLAGSNGETVSIGGNPGSLGAQGSVTLTASSSGFPSGVTYTWSASGSGASLSATSGDSTTLKVNNTADAEQSVTVSVTATGTETISGNDTKTYTDTATITIKVAGKAPVTLSQTSLSLAVGGTATLSATQGAETSGFSWTSGNTAVATVDSSGKVTAVKAGTATITASRNGASASCTVTVTDTAVTLKLDKASGTVQAGKTLTLTPTITGNATSSNKITWTSSNASIAKVSGDNSKATVTGVKKGDATITATYTENGKTVTATCAVKVTANPEQDTTTALKDKSGNQIYVKNAEGKYVTATYADYYKANQKFYIKQQGYKYTGWQTIDGKVYFYDANGNKVTGNQVIQGAQYSFDSNGVMVSSNGILGIDVSKWNGSIDWNAVKNSGVSYVIIRCGYRGSSQGSLVEDPRYRTNIQGATSAGLKVGVYFFTQAVNEVEAVEEASMVLSLVKGYKISYPIFLDVESSGGRGDGISKETRTAVCKAFCQTIQNSGYTAGIYANKTWLNNYIDVGQLGAYRIWLAQYASKPTYTGRYDIWQYSSKGQVSGISGNVDMNLSYMGY